MSPSEKAEQLYNEFDMNIDHAVKCCKECTALSMTGDNVSETLFWMQTDLNLNNFKNEGKFISYVNIDFGRGDSGRWSNISDIDDIIN
jgi:hypothetical protein